MKKNILLLFAVLSLITVTAQNSNERLSIRYFLGQTKAFILSSNNACHININESQKLAIECKEYSGKISLLFMFRNGLCYKVTLMPLSEESNSRFLYELGVLKEEGWSIAESSFDGSNMGVIKGTFVKGKSSIQFYYLLFGQFIDFEIVAN